jgi:tetratricopeptide (TPR) repeat protein
MNLGFAQLQRAEEHAERSRERTAALTAAQEAFHKAVLLDPINSDAHQGVALVRREFKDWTGAATWLESAVSADGETDLHDVDALCQLCVVYVISEKHDELNGTLQRLVDLTPDDDEAREYMAIRLAVLGSQMADASRFDEARAAFDHALRLNPDDEDIRKARDYAVHVSQGLGEWEVLEHDSRVIPPLKAFALASLARAEGAEIEDWRMEQTTRALYSYPRRKISSSLDRIESTYPSLYWLNSEWFDYVSSRAGRVKRRVAATAAVGVPTLSQEQARAEVAKPPRSRRRPALIALAVVVMVAAAFGIAALAGAFNGPPPERSSTDAAVVASIETLDAGLQAWAAEHGGRYPDRLTYKRLRAYVTEWPINAVTQIAIRQGTSPGDYYYSTAPGRTSYFLDGYGASGDAIVRLGD